MDITNTYLLCVGFLDEFKPHLNENQSVMGSPVDMALALTPYWSDNFGPLAVSADMVSSRVHTVLLMSIYFPIRSHNEHV